MAEEDFCRTRKHRASGPGHARGRRDKAPLDPPGPASEARRLTPWSGRSDPGHHQLPLEMVTGMICGYCMIVEFTVSNPFEVQATVY
jgi:hypothetical protein